MIDFVREIFVAVLALIVSVISYLAYYWSSSRDKRMDEERQARAEADRDIRSCVEEVESELMQHKLEMRQELDHIRRDMVTHREIEDMKVDIREIKGDIKQLLSRD